MFPEPLALPMQARLFTLRIWLVEHENEPVEWRARVQDIQNGDVKYFRDWKNLTAHLESFLQISDKNIFSSNFIEKIKPEEIPSSERGIHE